MALYKIQLEVKKFVLKKGSGLVVSDVRIAPHYTSAPQLIGFIQNFVDQKLELTMLLSVYKLPYSRLEVVLKKNKTRRERLKSALYLGLE